jgi:hypothetical protein
LQRQQDPLVSAGALAIGTQSIATPMNRTVADAISNTLVLQTMAG